MRDIVTREGLLSDTDRVPCRRSIAASWIGISLLAGAIAVLTVAPLALPSDYSPIEWTTSYSGAQGVQGASIARLGFVVAGCAVVLIAIGLRHRWRQPVTSLQVTVGVAFIVIAAFSVRPWRESVPYDHLENVVHGTAATIMGLAFASSVVALVWLRWRDDHVVDRVAVAVAVVSLIAPPLWGILSGASGAIQRAMLLMWAAWYFIEVWAASAET